MQRKIHESAYRYQKEVEKNEKIVVGVNKFQVDKKERFEILTINPEVEGNQVERLKAFKEKREQNKVRSHISLIKEKAETSENLVPYYIEAVKDGVTVGEISNALRELWGEYTDRKAF